MKADNKVIIALHDWKTYEVIEVNPATIDKFETLKFPNIGQFTRLYLKGVGCPEYVDVQEPIALIKRTLQMPLPMPPLTKAARRLHP